jgi:hypothetical protein
MLQTLGYTDVRVETIGGKLTDHYDPSSNVVRLSQSTAHSSSIAALGVVAHEIGHVMQHKEGYIFVKLRYWTAPVYAICTNLSWIFLFLGILFSWYQIAWLGVYLFSFATLFTVFTLPVEINASMRAYRFLSNYMDTEELYGVREVLTAAAMTYVAALVMAILQLLRMILIIVASDSSD